MPYCFPHRKSSFYSASAWFLNFTCLFVREIKYFYRWVRSSNVPGSSLAFNSLVLDMPGYTGATDRSLARVILLPGWGTPGRKTRKCWFSLLLRVSLLWWLPDVTQCRRRAVYVTVCVVGRVQVGVSSTRLQKHKERRRKLGWGGGWGGVYCFHTFAWQRTPAALCHKSECSIFLLEDLRLEDENQTDAGLILFIVVAGMLLSVSWPI